MALNDVVITKVNGGLGRRFPSTDGVCGLIANGVAAAGCVLGNTYKLQSVDDAIAMGLSASYDLTNKVLVYEHIKEFFRINPNGTLWLMVVAKSVVFKDMVDPTISTNAKKLLTDANGDINQLAVAYNPTVASTTDAALFLAIAQAQLLVADEYAKHRPLHVILEGNGFNKSTSADLRNLNAPGVSVMVGQSKAVLALDVQFAKSCAVGTLLGAVSLASVNQNVAWVQKFNLLGDTLQDWAIDGVQRPSITGTELSTLNDKGYIFFVSHTGISGIYFNDSHCADALTSDFCYIENNRTVNKATRLIRQALMPYLNSPIKVDSSTGFLAPEVVKAMEALGAKSLEQGMLSAGELSGFSFTINEEQNILSTSELKCGLTLTPTGTARKISVQISFSNPF